MEEIQKILFGEEKIAAVEAELKASVVHYDSEKRRVEKELMALERLRSDTQNKIDAAKQFGIQILFSIIT